MSEEQRRSEPLIRAIGDMRSELLGWIDERLEMLRRPEGSEAPAPVASPPAEDLRESAPTPRMVPETPCGPDVCDESIGRPTADDARRRLDNLARQLDERLRQTDSPSIDPDRTARDLTSNERA